MGYGNKLNYLWALVFFAIQFVALAYSIMVSRDVFGGNVEEEGGIVVATYLLYSAFGGVFMLFNFLSCFTNTPLSVKFMLMLLASISFMSFLYIEYAAKDFGRALIYPAIPVYIFMFYYLLSKAAPGVFIMNTWLYVVILIAASVVFLRIYYDVTWSKDNAVVQEGYYSLFILPWILANRNKLVRYVGIILIGAVVFFSAKRGGFVAYLGAVFVYFFIQNVFLEKRFRVVYIMLLPVLLVGVAGLAYYINIRTGSFISDRFDAIETSGGGGRFDIWRDLLSMYWNSDTVQKLFGKGFRATSFDSSLGLSAHNDYIETLYCYGFIGFIFIVGFLLSLCRTALKLIKVRSYYASSFAAALFMFIVLTNVSIVFYMPCYTLYIFAYFGSVYGAIQNGYCVIGDFGNSAFGRDVPDAHRF